MAVVHDIPSITMPNRNAMPIEGSGRRASFWGSEDMVVVLSEEINETNVYTAYPVTRNA